MDNYYLLHPAMAGAHYEGIKVRASHRSQWQTVENAPSLKTLNAHSRIGPKSGVGAVFYHDQNGFQKRLSGKLTYAHHLNFYRGYSEINQLSFGLSVGVFNGSHDQSSFDTSSSDPLITGFKATESAFFMDVGISYNRLGLYGHLTAKNILYVGSNSLDQLKSPSSPRSIVLNAGYFIAFDRGFSVEPSFLVRTVEYAEILNYDLTLKSHHSFNRFYGWLGVSYRRGFDINRIKTATRVFQKHQQLSFMAGFQVKTISLSYAYTQSLEDIQLATFNGHLFTVGIDIFGDPYKPITIRGIL